MKTQSRRISIGLCAMALGVAVAAQAAAPVITDTAMVPRFTIQSDLGVTNQIQYSTDLSHTNWVVLTNLLVTESPYRFVDADAPSVPQRFYRVLALETNSPVPPGMALIPAGSFTMGSTFNDWPPELGTNPEIPLHTVNVSAFYMDKYKVTKALWDDVYNWAITHGYGFEYGAQGKATNHPAQYMTWYDAVKWCNARSEKEGRTPAYYTSAGQASVYRSGQTDVQNDWVKWDQGYRLPTEAEWEKAARGGVSGQRFPWGNTISWSNANYYALPFSAGGYAYDVNPTEGYHPAFDTGDLPYTSPVGYFAANGYGLYDMAGNVFEWCWDWFGSYSSGSQTDPRGPASGSDRLIRAGGCYSVALNCRVAYRNDGGIPTGRGGSIGFRAVLPPGQ